MEKSTYPFNLVDNANEEIRQYGKEIQIVRNEDDGYYSIDILTIDEDGATKDTKTFAENLFENELPDFVTDALADVRKRERLKDQRKTRKDIPDAESLFARVSNALSHYEEGCENDIEEMYTALCDVHEWMERNIIN